MKQNTPTLEEFIAEGMIKIGEEIKKKKAAGLVSITPLQLNDDERSAIERFYEYMIQPCLDNYVLRMEVNLVSDKVKKGLIEYFIGNYNPIVKPTPKINTESFSLKDCHNILVRIIIGYRSKQQQKKGTKPSQEMFRSYPVYDIGSPEEAENAQGALYMLRGGHSQKEALENLDKGLKTQCRQLDPKHEFIVYIYPTKAGVEAMMRRR